MNPIYEKLEKMLSVCQGKRPIFVPEVAIILGSGFGQFADEFEEVKKISYHEIEGFPVSTVQGHAGEFIFWLYAGCAGGIDERKSTLL